MTTSEYATLTAAGQDDANTLYMITDGAPVSVLENWHFYANVDIDGQLKASGDVNVYGNLNMHGRSLYGNRLRTVSIATNTTLVGTDTGAAFIINSSTDATITVPAGLNNGFDLTIMQLGTGKAILSAAGGVSISSAGNNLKSVQFQSMRLTSYAADQFILTGETSA